MTDNAKGMGDMFQVSASDKMVQVQKEMAEAKKANREALYVDDAIWDHEFCGPECDGQPHV